MNPEGLERPDRGTLREFRNRMNRNPTRFIIDKYIPIINTGEYYDDNNRIFYDRIVANEGYDYLYEYEEVNLSSITEGDVVLFSDSNIPFWTAHRTQREEAHDIKTITAQKITFRPCGIRRKIGEHVVHSDGRLHRTGNFQFWNKPIGYHTTMTGDVFLEVYDDFYRSFNDKTDKQKVVKLGMNTLHFLGVPHITMNRKMICRNGERREIRVRKFTGTEAEMQIHDDQGREAMFRLFHQIMWKINSTYYEIRGSYIHRTPVIPDSHPYVSIPKGPSPEGENENY